jgi:hypothetical protein
MLWVDEKNLDRKNRSVIIGQYPFFMTNNNLTGGLAISRIFASGDPARR